MKVAIPMVFPKSTKRTTVFATGDGPAPVENVYVSTSSLRSHGISREAIVLAIADVPLSLDVDGGTVMVVKLRVSRTTRRKTLFEAVDADAPIDRLYIVTEWLRSQCFGEELYLGISSADSGDGIETDEPDGPSEATIDASDAFEAFLASAIIRREGSWITTEQIRVAWADHLGASSEDDIIAGRFRSHFSAPPGSRGRVDGRVQYRWEGYVIRGSEEA